METRNKKRMGLFGLLLLPLVMVACGGAQLAHSSRDPSTQSAFHQKPKKHLWEYKKSHFNLYTTANDIRFGEQIMEAQIKEFEKKKVPVDPPKYKLLKNRIEKIVHKIAAVSDRPQFPYEVTIFDRPDIVNAFCLPGGKIGVFTGLFDPQKGLVAEKSDDEIAAVIGHEIAHATMRHVTRTLTTMQGLGLFGSVVSITIGEGVGVQAQGIFERVFSLGANLYFPTYSRKHEREADQVGFFYLSRAGYNPEAAIKIWKRAAEKGGSHSKKTDFFASHPASGERAKTLEGWLPEAKTLVGAVPGASW